MKVQYINPFITASLSVIEMTLGMKVQKGSLTMRPEQFLTQQCNIIVGVTGKVRGQVVYGMSLVTADKIASVMLGQPVKTFDQLAASAIAELGNMISGNASTLLAEAGYECDITPPSIVRGNSVNMTTVGIPALVVPLCLELGEVELTVCLEEKR